MSSLLLNKSVTKEQCFHCGDTLRGTTYSACIDGIDQPMCCIGCQAAAQLIENAGMGDFYRQRSETTNNSPAQQLDEDYWQQFDSPELQGTLIQIDGDSHSVNLSVKTMYCSACTWLIERSYQNIHGIEDLSINLSHKRIRIQWHADSLKLSEVLLVLARLGYQPQPLSSLDSASQSHRESHSALQRIAVAGPGMM